MELPSAIYTPENRRGTNSLVRKGRQAAAQSGEHSVDPAFCRIDPRPTWAWRLNQDRFGWTGPAARNDRSGPTSTIIPEERTALRAWY